MNILHKNSQEGDGSNKSIDHSKHLVDAISHRVNLSLSSISPEEIGILETHSLRNMLNPIQGYITLLGILAEEYGGGLKKSMEVCDYINTQLGEKNPEIDWGKCNSVIRQDIADAFGIIKLSENDQITYEEEMQILTEICSAFGFQIKEFLQRKALGDRFVPFSKKEVVADLENIFGLMAANSRGRYGVVFDETKKTDNDYCILIDFMKWKGKTQDVSFPVVFNDIFRDLLANARKYSPVGATIYASITEEMDRVVFRVVDSGRGIPEQEMSDIGKYGYRATNVRGDVRGFGHGVTKAVFYTNKLGGTIQIRSKEGVGTDVEIQIPRPQKSYCP